MRTTGLLTLFVALLWAGCANEPAPEDKLFADSFMLPEIVITAPKSRGDLDSTPLADAIKSYKGGKYKKAVTNFSAFLEKNPEFPDAIDVKYYRAMCLLKLDQPTEAVPDLQDVVAANNKNTAQAKWFLGLTYIKLREKEKAVALLQDLKRSGTPQAQKAAVALKTMDEWPD